VLTDAQKHRFEENLELDLSFGIKGLARFRANVFHQRGAIAAAFRQIPYEIRGFRDLGLPPIIEPDRLRRPAASGNAGTDIGCSGRPSSTSAPSTALLLLVLPIMVFQHFQGQQLGAHR